MMRRASTLAPSAARGAVSATTRPFAPSIITPTASQSVQARRSYHANTLGSSNAARPSLGPRATYQPSQARRSYHEKVLDHYSNPRNVGSMSKTDTDVGTGLVGAPACGDVMKLQIRVNKADGKIDDVKFKTFGCGSAIASSSYLTQLVRGMTLEEAGRVRNTEIAKELCLPPVKLHCSMLAEDAIKSAISNYYTKNPKAKATDLGGTSAEMPKIEIEKVNATTDTSAAATA